MKSLILFLFSISALAMEIPYKPGDIFVGQEFKNQIKTGKGCLFVVSNVKTTQGRTDVFEVEGSFKFETPNRFITGIPNAKFVLNPSDLNGPKDLLLVDTQFAGKRQIDYFLKIDRITAEPMFGAVSTSSALLDIFYECEELKRK